MAEHRVDLHGVWHIRFGEERQRSSRVSMGAFAIKLGVGSTYIGHELAPNETARSLLLTAEQRNYFTGKWYFADGSTGGIVALIAQDANFLTGWQLLCGEAGIGTGIFVMDRDVADVTREVPFVRPAFPKQEELI